jgi:hypothetical protein
MPSRALQKWKVESSRALNAFEQAHRTARMRGIGRRFVSGQIAQAYVLMLSSRFQQFCRDLHSESTEHLVHVAVAAELRVLLWTGFIAARRLDGGNPHPGSIGADFGRLGIRIWDEVGAAGRRNAVRQRRLEEMIAWRNAIAHQDFRRPVLGGRSMVAIQEVRRWRRACDLLATEMDRVMTRYLAGLTAVEPWKEEAP